MSKHFSDVFRESHILHTLRLKIFNRHVGHALTHENPISALSTINVYHLYFYRWYPPVNVSPAGYANFTRMLTAVLTSFYLHYSSTYVRKHLIVERSREKPARSTRRRDVVYENGTDRRVGVGAILVTRAD
ncbi:hypothetical protein PUN28_012481 [Cardiocondyla obscurior]|uniref:Uncharacterized protein n=1 Tax=Cardiocondyla obscurior TaxID=286306 RepID=A0AAW2FGQ9_9HYME